MPDQDVPELAEVLALLSSARHLVFHYSVGGKPHAQQRRDGARLLPQIDAMLARYPTPKYKLVDDGKACARYFQALADEQELRREMRRAERLVQELRSDLAQAQAERDQALEARR